MGLAVHGLKWSRDVTSSKLAAVTQQALEHRVALREQIRTYLTQLQPELRRWQILLKGEAWRK